MSQAVFIPLFALALWMTAFYADNKFRHFYNRKEAMERAGDETGIKRFIILRNQELKYLGLGLLWAGFSIGWVLANGNSDTISQAAYAFGVFGLLVYMISRIWPFLSK